MKKLPEERVLMPLLGYESVALCVSNLAKSARGIEAGGYSENGLRYCILLRPWHTLPFLKISRVRRNAKKFERRHRTGSKSSYFAGGRN